MLGENVSVHASTLNAIRTKLRVGNNRIPSFIDREAPTDALGNRDR